MTTMEDNQDNRHFPNATWGEVNNWVEALHLTNSDLLDQTILATVDAGSTIEVLRLYSKHRRTGAARVLIVSMLYANRLV